MLTYAQVTRGGRVSVKFHDIIPDVSRIYYEIDLDLTVEVLNFNMNG